MPRTPQAEQNLAALFEHLPPMIKPPELAELIHSTTDVLAQNRHLGRGIPWISVGRRILYAKSDVIAFFEANRVDTTRKAGA